MDVFKGKLGQWTLALWLLWWVLPGFAQLTSGVVFNDGFEDPIDLPDNPEEVASPLPFGFPYDLGDGTEFLYTGPDPIQTGVAPGTIDKQRVAILRGRLLDAAANGLAGARISVLDHPELGQTLTRSDGWFDLAVNGGSLLIVLYEKDGWLPVQRQVEVPWQDFVSLPDVVLAPLNSKIDRISLAPGMPMQMAQGSPVTDEAGTRQGTVLFPSGVAAEMVMEDGDTEPLDSLDVRVTEYTVGPMGPQAMPAGLPPSSAYTYAVELSVDQAMASGAETVRFDQPVPYYVDNFLNLPVGTAVPYGFYDRSKGQWIAEPDGVVLKILDVLPAGATVDTDGDDQLDAPARLDALGIDAAELEALASLYPAGATLWRVRLTHFSPHDFNLPPEFIPPEDADEPPPPDDESPTSGGGSGSNKPKDFSLRSDDPCEQSGSIVECQNRVLGEEIPIAGTAFQLTYRSDRGAGYKIGRSTTVRLSDDSVPDSLKRIDLEIQVAGQRIERSYPPDPDQTDEFEWDGLDAYGRPVLGSARANIRISYVYDLRYCPTPLALEDGGDAPPQSFGRACGGDGTQPAPAPREASLDLEYQTVLRGGSQSWAELGQWDLSVHHGYDPVSRTLYYGDGRQNNAPSRVGSIIDTFAGGGTLDDDGVSATEARLPSPRGLAVGPDGSVYVSERSNRVRKIDPFGNVTTVAGQFNVGGFAGDGGPASEAVLQTPGALGFGPDGSLYVSDDGNRRIRRITPDGLIDTVVGGGDVDVADIDGGLATDLARGTSIQIAVAADGTLYISSFFALQVSTDGKVTLLQTRPSGAGPWLDPNDDLPWFGLNGPLMVEGQNMFCLQKVIGLRTADYYCFKVGDTNSEPDFDDRPISMEFQADGSVLVRKRDHCLRRYPSLPSIGRYSSTTVEPTLVPDPRFRPTLTFTDVTANLHVIDDGNGEVIVGRDSADPNGCIDDRPFPDDSAAAEDGGPAVLGSLDRNSPYTATAPDRSVLLLDPVGGNSDPGRVRRIRPPLPGSSGDDIDVADPDSSLLYRFDRRGRHLQTLNTLTGAVLYSFEYDAAGRLVTVIDGFGSRTVIERDAGGTAQAIVGPFGQRTTLAFDSNGLLASVANPAGETHSFSYSNELLTELQDPAGNLTTYTYNNRGALATVTADDGYEITLSTTRLANGQRNATTSALGLVREYTTVISPDGETVFTSTAPDGTQTVTVLSQDASTTTTSPTGMVSVSSALPDQRYGIQDPGGEVFAMQSPGGKSLEVITQRTVDLVNVDDPLSLVSLTRTRTVGARTSTTFYDAATRTVTATSPTGRVQTVELDPLGQVVSSQGGPALAPGIKTYDASGRLTRNEQGSESLSYEYDTAGRIAAQSNGAGQRQAFTYDSADRPVSLTTPGNRTYGYGYDARGTLRSVTMPNGAVHELDENLARSLSLYQAPGGSPLTVSYDLDRRKTGQTLQDGRSIVNTFNAVGQWTGVSYPEATISIEYGANSPLISRMSRTATAGGPATELTFTYDGDLLTGMDVPGGSFTYRRDDSLRLAGIQLESEPEWTLVHDDDDLVTTFGPFTLTRTGPGGAPGTFSDSALTISYSFDNLGRLTGREHSIGGTVVYGLDLAFETGTGRIASRTETIGGAASTLDYGYSADGELTGVSEGAVSIESYGYDVNGNRTAANGQAAIFDTQDRIQSAGGVSYTVDANGMLTARGSDIFSYSARGELLSVQLESGPTISYGYDALGRRVSRTDASGTAQYLFGHPNNPFLVLASRDASGVLTRYFYDEADILVALERSGSRFYLVSDQVGSPRAVFDVAGTLQRRIDYDSFGVVTADSNPGFDLPIGFAGGLSDAATGLVRFGFRDYDPAAGRWTARDPLLFDAGQPNLYAYSNSNPISLRDPTGLFCIGFSAYEGYGGAVKLCVKNATLQLCGETGFGAGIGGSIDFTGTAKAGFSSYTKGELSLGCGPLSAGVSANLDNCGEVKVCATPAASIFGFTGAAPACKQVTLDEGIPKFTADGASLAGSLALGIKPKDQPTGGPQAAVNVQGLKVKCKASAGLKGGACFGVDLF